jgi:hypothetical protein
VEVANRVQFTSDRTTILRIVNGNRRSEVRSNVIEAEKSRSKKNGLEARASNPLI